MGIQYTQHKFVRTLSRVRPREFGQTLNWTQLWQREPAYRGACVSCVAGTGWPKKVSHYQMINKIALHRIKACQWD